MALTQVPIELSSTPGIVDNSNATAITIDSSENVGIGTSSPDTLVHAYKASNAILKVAEANGFVSLQQSGVNSYLNNVASGGSLIFRNGTAPTERMRIDSSGNVGIGCSPGVALDINRATSTASYARVGNGGNVQAYIGVAGDNLPVLGSFTNHALRMVVNASEVARFDTSGNLLVGKTSSDLGATAGIELNGQYDVGYFTRSGDKPLVVNRLSSDGTIADFRKNGSTVGSIGVTSGNDLVIDGTNSSTDTGLKFVNGALRPRQNSTDSDGDVNLGAGSFRFKDLYLSGGAFLGGTAAANKLDDYEEGTWTGSATAGASSTLTVADEKYTKIGNQVTIQCTINFSGASGSLEVAGLPFASAPAAVGIGREDATSGYAVYGRVASGNTTFSVFYAGGVSNATPFQVSAGNMRISMTYLT